MADITICRQLQLRVEDLSRTQVEQELARLRQCDPNAMTQNELDYYNEVLCAYDEINAED
jgi:hypothetical protein